MITFVCPKKGLIPVSALALLVATPMTPIMANPLVQALEDGEATLGARYRFEHVDQEDFDDDARASTLRATLGYQTGEAYGFSGFIEAEHVTAIGPENFNSPTNDRTSRPLVADPTETEINQAYLSYQGPADTDLRYGRQKFGLDNERFIGSVSWRQNEQTFDAATLVNQSLPDTTLTLGYLYNANRLVSDAFGPRGNDGMRTGVINARYEGLEAGTVTGYSYLLSYNDMPDSSTATTGLRFSGNSPLGDDLQALYTLEYARQSDYDNNGQSFDLDYYKLEAGARLQGVTLTLGQEMLGSDGGEVAFETPLATLHAMNGWTDQFLNVTGATDGDGLVDTYLSVGGSAGGFNLKAIHHRFESERGSRDLGNETGLLAVYPVSANLTLGAKAATYSADDTGVDTDKAWLWASARF